MRGFGSRAWKENIRGSGAVLPADSFRPILAWNAGKTGRDRGENRAGLAGGHGRATPEGRALRGLRGPGRRDLTMPMRDMALTNLHIFCQGVWL